MKNTQNDVQIKVARCNATLILWFFRTFENTNIEHVKTPSAATPSYRWQGIVEIVSRLLGAMQRALGLQLEVESTSQRLRLQGLPSNLQSSGMGGWLEFLVTLFSGVSRWLFYWSCLVQPSGKVAQAVQSNMYKTLFFGWGYGPLVVNPLFH